MRMNELAVVVAEQGAKRHFAKKAGVVMPLAIGAMLPGIFHKAVDTYHNTKDRLDAAAHQQLADIKTGASHANPFAGRSGPSFGAGLGEAAMGGVHSGVGQMAGLPLQGLAKGLGGVMNTGLERLFFGREFGDKHDAKHMLGQSAIGAFGKEMGATGAGLLRDIGNKAMAAVGAMGDQSAREAILKQLKREDPILGDAPDKVLMEAYHTMQRFAPTLSTDKNAVRSFLRQAVMNGVGPDYASIKLLADTERAITGDKRE
jgi:hypothetical protein